MYIKSGLHTILVDIIQGENKHGKTNKNQAYIVRTKTELYVVYIAADFMRNLFALFKRVSRESTSIKGGLIF